MNSCKPSALADALAKPHLAAVGAATGTLLYPLLSGHGRPELPRALFIGLFVGLVHWLVFRSLRARRAQS